MMRAEDATIKEGFNRKVYWYFNKKYAWIAKYYSSKWWNPFDWYLVKFYKDKKGNER